MSKMVIYAAIISFLFGLITAQIAKWKGRNLLAWFCLGGDFQFSWFGSCLDFEATTV